MTRIRNKHSENDPAEPRRVVSVLVIGGFLLLAGLWYIRVLAGDFEYGSPMLERPILEFVAVMMALGLVYAALARYLTRADGTAPRVVFILALGVAMRVVFLGTNPILEDDYYRYLWDGAVVANGGNPYSLAPGEVADGADPGLRELAKQSGVVIARINHPALTTVYPPIAQGAFAIAHALGPWDLNAWRVVLLGSEAAVAALLMMLLRAAGKPLHWVLIYWWNPLAALVTLNAAHMDVIALPFILLAVLFTLKNRAAATCIAGALAVCAKLWPLVLAPVLLRNLRAKPTQLAIALVFGAATLLAVGSPMYAAADRGSESGLAAYGYQWEMNDALFMVLLRVAESSVATFNGEPEQAQFVARLLIAAIVVAVVAFVSMRPAHHGAALVNRLALVTGVLFMLLPAQFPWYYLWVLPFLVVAPRASLLSLTVTLPSYYLKFYYAAQGDVEFFHTRIVWIEYAPCLVLATIELLRYLTQATRDA